MTAQKRQKGQSEGKRRSSSCPSRRSALLQAKEKRRSKLIVAYFYHSTHVAVIIPGLYIGLQDVLLRYIQNKDERIRILYACHIDKTAGHMGKTRTLFRIKERFMWHGVKDVKNMAFTHNII